MREAARALNDPSPVEQLRAANTALEARNAALERELKTLQHQLEWFKRQLFGRTSERCRVLDPAHQPLLTGLVESQTTPPAPERTEHIAYERRKLKGRSDACVTEEGLRFDASVPVERIELSAPQLQGPEAADYEVIAYKSTRRLAQRPGSYVVLEYVRPVLRRKSSGALSTVPAPGRTSPPSATSGSSRSTSTRPASS